MFFSYPRVVIIRASFLMSVWGEQDALLPFLLQCLQDLSQDAWHKKGFDRKTCTLLSLLFWPFSLYKFISVPFQLVVITCTFLPVLV